MSVVGHVKLVTMDPNGSWALVTRQILVMLRINLSNLPFFSIFFPLRKYYKLIQILFIKN